MGEQLWGSLSIFDHRDRSRIARSLVFFDRIVFPVLSEPKYGVSEEELTELSGLVRLLEDAGAAKHIVWHPGDFFEHVEGDEDQKKLIREALAKVIDRDPPFATRLIVAQRYNTDLGNLTDNAEDSVHAIPVYSGEEEYESSTKEIEGHVAESATVQLILKKVPVPSVERDFDRQIDKILKLRKRDSFRESMYNLRDWQYQTVTEFLRAQDVRVLARAETQLDRWIKQYSEALEEAKITRVEIGIVSVLAAGAAFVVGGPALAVAAGVAQPLFSMRKLTTPCWKDVAQNDCFAAGVIYEAGRL